MKAESKVKPEKYNIDIRGEKTIVTLFDNIQKVEENEEENKEVKYTYDVYEIKLHNKENLKDEIESKYQEYLEKAKTEEYNKLAKEIREQRDKLLADTDWTHLQDTSLDSAEKEKYRIYRQKLKDVPQQEGFPYNVEFPKLEE